VKSRLARYGGLLFFFLFSSPLFAFSLPPSSKTKEQAFPLPGNYQEVWNATLETLNEEKIPLHTVDASRGYIQTQTFPLFRKEYRAWSKKPAFVSPGFCMLEIGVVHHGPSVTVVGIKAYFKRKHGLYLFGYRKKDRSRGQFEKLLAGRVNDRLMKQKYPRLKHIIVGCHLRYEESLSRYVIREAGPGGLGYEQGLRDGDILLKIDGHEVHPGSLFPFLLEGKGETVRRFTLKRKRKELELPVSIFSLNPDALPLGFSTARDPETGKFKVEEVAGGSPAEKAGLRAGDFLIQENETPLDSWRHYYRALASEKPGRAQAFLIERENASLVITVG